MKAYFNNQDIKAAKLALVNQELTSFQTAILAQHINDLEYRLKKMEQNIKDAMIVINNENYDYDDGDFEGGRFADAIVKELTK